MSYDEKYGIQSTSDEVIQFHRQRTMFAIRDGTLHLATRGLDYSHAVWFTKLGWMTEANDRLMEEVTRGYVDRTGVYAYVGFDFRTNDKVESELVNLLPTLRKRLKLSTATQVHAGLVRGTDGKWTPIKTIMNQID